MNILFAIGGITDQKYFGNAISQAVLDRGFDRFAELDAEEYFDEGQWGLTNWVPLFDKLGDVRQFALDERLRERIRKQCQEKMESFAAPGSEITMVTHSLGSWISAGINADIDHLVMLGSPISWPGWFGRKLIHREILGLERPIRAKRITYLWSKRDPVASKGEPPTEICLKLTGGKPLIMRCHETGTSHDAADYLDWIRKQHKLIF